MRSGGHRGRSRSRLLPVARGARCAFRGIEIASSTLLIYDGDCGFCRWGMHVVRRLDRAGVFGFCPYGHPVAESILSELPPEKRYTSHHAFRDGILYSATAAARVTLEGLPLGRVAVALQLHRPYPTIARNRALLGRLVPHRSVINTCQQTTVPVSGG